MNPYTSTAAANPAATPPSLPDNTPPRTSGKAIASLVCGILSIVLFSILTGIPAIICGHLAKKEIKKSNNKIQGKGMALAGLITGYISIGIIVLATMAALAAPLLFKQLAKADIASYQQTAKVAHAQLFDYSMENGQFPEFLGEIDAPGLTEIDFEGNSKWIYFPGFDISSDGSSIILATAKPINGKIVTLKVNGKVETITEADYEAAIRAQQNP